MRILKTFREVGLAAVVAAATIAAFSSSSTAAKDGSSTPQEMGGTLSGTGYVTVNSMQAQSGATVASGSSIVTGGDGNYVLDLGTAGKVTMRPNTNVRVTYTASGAQLVMEYCSSLLLQVPAGSSMQVMGKSERWQVATTRGQAVVNKEDQRGRKGSVIVNAGDHKTINYAKDLTATGDAVVTINCCSCCFIERKY